MAENPGQQTARESRTVVNRQVRVAFQKTIAASRFYFDDILSQANLFLSDFAFALTHFGNQPTIQFPSTYFYPNDSAAVFKESLKIFGSNPRILRVVAVPFDPKFATKIAITEDSMSGKDITEPYILLNTRNKNLDGKVLVHEIIHAAGLDIHSENPNSVFATIQNKEATIFEDVYQAALAQASFVGQRPAD